MTPGISSMVLYLIIIVIIVAVIISSIDNRVSHQTWSSVPGKAGWPVNLRELPVLLPWCLCPGTNLQAQVFKWVLQTELMPFPH